jgi:RNA recognition motif-containing protein
MASSTVFVSNFPFATTEDELRSRFEELAGVRSVRIIVDRETGRSRGFAFVELLDPDAIDGVIGALDGTEMKGRRLAVSKARGRTGAEPPRSSPRPAPHGDDIGNVAAAPHAEPFRHRIVIDWLEDSAAYLASVPDLDVAAQAATIEAAVREVQSRARHEAGGALRHEEGD